MMIQIKEILAKNFQSPGDEFTRYFVRSLNNGKSTPKLIEEYRPIVRKSILSVIGGMISGRPEYRHTGERRENTTSTERWNGCYR